MQKVALVGADDATRDAFLVDHGWTVIRAEETTLQLLLSVLAAGRD